MRLILLIILVFITSIGAQAQSSKTIVGQVIDKDSKFPIQGAIITVISAPSLTAVTDAQGYFNIKNVPITRISLKASFVGYKDALINDVLVIAGKELQLNIEMEEKVTEIKEILVSSNNNKTKIKNEFVMLSAQSFDVEQTARFSGSRNDPARMAANFAGVSGANDARNDIVIRGNSPMGLLWRLEGIDIPSPNHFSSFGSTGGPVSMLNNNTLAKSDFITAAFPAEYGNALAGVLDLKMRNGNRDKHEFVAQLGFNGIELGAEGPFNKKKSNATYLINYRYSTLRLFKLIKVNFGTGNAVPEYQDISFKFDIPTKKAGIFKIFAVGGFSSIDLIGSQLDLTKKQTSLYGNENEDIYNKVKTGIIGMAHTYFINPKTFSKVVLAASHQQQLTNIDTVNFIDRNNIKRYSESALRSNKYSLHALVNKKINTQHTFVLGTIYDIYDLKFSDSVQYKSSFLPLKYGKGLTALIQTYANWQFKITAKLTMNTGLHLQYFLLSNSTALEPRFGIKYQIGNRQSIAFGYGLHHQIQTLPTYYNRDISSVSVGKASNLEMGFSRSNHFVIGYDILFAKDFHLKSEIYFQYIDKVPVEQFESSFSMLNAGAEFSTPNNTSLVNKGIGKNVGLELTLEKSFSKGYYFLLTSSLFQSKYQGSDHVWRNTAFNGQYVVNALAGYEYKFGGKKKQNNHHDLSIDAKLTLAGGRYYTPINFVESALQAREIRMEEKAYSKSYPAYFRPDVKISYRFNRKKVTQEISLDFQNFVNYKNVLRKSYNSRTNTETTAYQQGIFILPQFKLYF